LLESWSVMPDPDRDGAGLEEHESAPQLVLAAGATFRGVLALPGPARIDGRVAGEVIAGGPLWIGETGEIEADLEAESVVVAGRVSGSVRAGIRIEVRPSGTIQGGLEAPRIVLAEGSVVNGHCHSGDSNGAAKSGPERRVSP
jgi:cytoskeletal protein CcmA (bactofilin family)